MAADRGNPIIWAVELEDCDGYDWSGTVLARDKKEAHSLAIYLYRKTSARADSAAIVRINSEPAE